MTFPKRVLMVVTIPLWFPPMVIYSIACMLTIIPVWGLSWFVFGDPDRMGEKYQDIIFSPMDRFEEWGNK